MRVTRSRFQGVLFHSTCGGGGGRSGVIFVSGAFWRTSIKYIHRASVCVCINFFAFLATAEEVSPEGKVPSMLRTGTEYEASGSTRDIHELQAALQAAQLTATGTGSRYSGKINFIMKTLI